MNEITLKTSDLIADKNQLGTILHDYRVFKSIQLETISKELNLSIDEIDNIEISKDIDIKNYINLALHYGIKIKITLDKDTMLYGRK